MLCRCSILPVSVDMLQRTDCTCVSAGVTNDGETNGETNDGEMPDELDREQQPLTQPEEASAASQPEARDPVRLLQQLLLHAELGRVGASHCTTVQAHCKQGSCLANQKSTGACSSSCYMMQICLTLLRAAPAETEIMSAPAAAACLLYFRRVFTCRHHQSSQLPATSPMLQRPA